jgi:hypothetical protein
MCAFNQFEPLSSNHQSTTSHFVTLLKNVVDWPEEKTAQADIKNDHV